MNYSLETLVFHWLKTTNPVVWVVGSGWIFGSGWVIRSGQVIGSDSLVGSVEVGLSGGWMI